MKKEKIIDAIGALYWLSELDGLNTVLGLKVFFDWQKAKGQGVSFREFGAGLSPLQQKAITDTIKRGVVPAPKPMPMPVKRKYFLFPVFGKKAIAG